MNKTDTQGPYVQLRQRTGACLLQVCYVHELTKAIMRQTP
jgi:hypothetical protein